VGKKKAEELYSLWQFSICTGGTDGNHVEIQVPQKYESLFCKYKKPFFVVVLELVDANYQFTTIHAAG
jgi:hypothetical protein